MGICHRLSEAKQDVELSNIQQLSGAVGAIEDCIKELEWYVRSLNYEMPAQWLAHMLRPRR